MIDGLILLCTGQPCAACADAILNSRSVSTVLYRDRSGVGDAGEDKLHVAGVNVFHMGPNKPETEDG